MSKNNRRDHVKEAYYDPFLRNMVSQGEGDIETLHLVTLTELALNRFKWHGFPDGNIDERYLEMSLHLQGLCVFFYNNDYDRYMALRGTYSNPNFYNNPTLFTVTGNGMVNKTLDARECVPIWANRMRGPEAPIVHLYTRRLTDIDTTIDINIKQARTPLIASGTEEERLTISNIARQVDRGDPVIYVTDTMADSMNAGRFNVFNTGMNPDLIPKMMIARSKIWNECMTMLGIDNANQDKRERLVADEVKSNDEQISANRRTALTMREEACEQINRMFGLEVSVSWNYENELNAATLAPTMIGGGTNGDVHYRTEESGRTD